MHFGLVILFVAAANAAQLLRVSEPISGRYIVKIKSGIDVQSVLPSVRLAGGRVRSVFDNVLNGFAAELSDEVLDVVLNLPSVEYVEEDGVVRAMDTQWNPTWGLDRIDQRDLPLNSRYTYPRDGTGVSVYVIDTGILNSHNDFGSRSKSGYDFANNDNDATDDNGHGTHCAGTVGGDNYGVAKNVDLYGVKVLGRFGSGSNSDVVAGINWVANNHEKPAVASMSLGGGASVSTDSAVRGLISNGVPTAVAAGNDNANACNYSPARVDEAVTVGATDSSDSRSSFSNYGSCLDIFAPGSSITSTWHTSNSATNTISGTSMACPHVAGALAIECAQNNNCNSAASGVTSNASSNKISNSGWGSPNLLLYVA